MQNSQKPSSPLHRWSDPVGVFAVACRNKAKLAVSHTFSIDVVHEISEERLQAMTAETYHRLSAEHVLRQDRLVDAVDRTKNLWQ